MPTESRRRVLRTLLGVFGRGQRVPEDWDLGLAPEDAAFAQALLGLCLRRWGRIQAWIRPRLKSPDRGLPLGSQAALTLGLAQLAWLEGVSDHAAVHESVSLAADPELGFPPHRGLVNALLRQAAKDRGGLRETLNALPASLDRTPFAERLLDAALPGAAPEDRETLWARLQVPPQPVFRRLSGDPLPEGLEAHPALEGALRLREGAAFPRPWLSAGQGMVQDLSSQALLAFRWDREPKRILDACAAPGGKTAALAKRWPNAEIFALERDPRRMQRLRQNLEARKVKAQVVEAEATAWLAEGGKPFDLILVDAPCSGSGTLRKHPELTWIGDRIDLRRLSTHQDALLHASLGRLAPEGCLLYAVCSWFPEEGVEHLDRLPGGLHSVAVWPEALLRKDGSRVGFGPDPLRWDGEGFQAFALHRG